MNSSSHIKTQKLTGENWVKGRETIQFYKSGMKNGINVNISVIIKSSHYNNVFDFQSGKQHNKFNSCGSRIITYLSSSESTFFKLQRQPHGNKLSMSLLIVSLTPLNQFMQYTSQRR